MDREIQRPITIPYQCNAMQVVDPLEEVFDKFTTGSTHLTSRRRLKGIFGRREEEDMVISI